MHRSIRGLRGGIGPYGAMERPVRAFSRKSVHSQLRNFDAVAKDLNRLREGRFSPPTARATDSSPVASGAWSASSPAARMMSAAVSQSPWAYSFASSSGSVAQIPKIAPVSPSAHQYQWNYFGFDIRRDAAGIHVKTSQKPGFFLVNGKDVEPQFKKNVPGGPFMIMAAPSSFPWEYDLPVTPQVPIRISLPTPKGKIDLIFPETVILDRYDRVTSTLSGSYRHVTASGQIRTVDISRHWLSPNQKDELEIRFNGQKGDAAPDIPGFTFQEAKQGSGNWISKSTLAPADSGGVHIQPELTVRLQPVVGEGYPTHLLKP